MRIWKRVCALALAALLVLPAAASAQSYTDLPVSHWAYDDMTQAADLGIIQGVGDGRIDPSGTLSWGQFLTMFTRTFASGEYAAALSSGLAWDQAGLQAALNAGYLDSVDPLPVLQGGNLSDPVSRQDAAILLSRALPKNAGVYGWQSANAASFTDWNQMDPFHQAAVSALADHGVVSGRTDGSFGCADTIQRSDGAVLLMRVLSLVDQVHYGEQKMVTVRVVDQTTGQSILPDQQMNVSVGDSLSYLAYQVEPGYYNYDGSYVTSISTACDVYTLDFAPMTQAEIQEAQFWEKVDRGEASYDDYWTQDFLLGYQGENPRKYLLLFGSQDKRRFSSKEEAEAAMTTITVPVWKLSNGVKTPSTMSLTVHAALAQDVTEIFTEIYNDPEQFPIHDVGGYSWRGDSATGEHNCGTAIDINANENCQIRDGQVLAGSHWTPGADPYSIGPDSSVVRIFTEHGWSWGGDAWEWDSDISYGYHDYMHFSYMGG